VHKENSLSSSKRGVSEEDTHRVVEHSVENKVGSAGKVCFESRIRVSEKRGTLCRKAQQGHERLCRRDPLKGEEGPRPLGD
jgi:hypothetical protein